MLNEGGRVSFHYHQFYGHAPDIPGKIGFRKHYDSPMTGDSFGVTHLRDLGMRQR